MFPPNYTENLLARQQVIHQVNPEELFNIKEVSDDPSFVETMGKLIREINESPPGQELFSRLSTALQGRKITICHGMERGYEEPEYDPETNTVYFSTALKTYYISNETLQPHPLSITLAHELIHAMHFLENKNEAIQRLGSTKDLITPLLTNKEEQETIQGTLSEQGVSLCENAFLAHRKLPLRENHAQGILLRTPLEEIQLHQLICVQSRPLIKNYLERFPDSLNQLYDNDWMQGIKPQYFGAGKKFHPLTLAFKMGFFNIAEELISHPNLDPAFTDDFGGPLVSACAGGHYKMAEKLIDKLNGNQTCLKESLARLLTYWEKCEISDDKEFYDLLIKIDDSIQGSHSYLLDLLTQVPADRSNQLLYHVAETNKYKSDSSGNTVHMNILKSLESMKGIFRGRSGQVTYLKSRIEANEVNLAHINNQGQTFLDIATQLGVIDKIFTKT